MEHDGGRNVHDITEFEVSDELEAMQHGDGGKRVVYWHVTWEKRNAARVGW